MVSTECKPRHRHQEFLAFLRRLDACVPQDLEIHLIVDNYATHKHAKVRTWLALTDCICSESGSANPPIVFSRCF